MVAGYRLPLPRLVLWQPATGNLLCAFLHPAKFVDDLSLGGKASLIVFREDALVVDSDVEDAAASAHDLTVDSQFLLDLGRQTGGPRQIVSDAAVVDSYVHGFSS